MHRRKNRNSATERRSTKPPTVDPTITAVLGWCGETRTEDEDEAKGAPGVRDEARAEEVGPGEFDNDGVDVELEIFSGRQR